MSEQSPLANLSDDQRRELREAAAAKLRAMNGKPRGTQARPLDWLALLATFVLLGVGWSKTFSDMWMRWFERWHRTELSLIDRLTEGQSYYTHGPLVPLASLLIAFFIYKKVGIPVGRHEGEVVSAGGGVKGIFGSLSTHRGAVRLGWWVLGGFLLVHVMSCNAGVMFASGFALIGVLFGLLLIWGGWPLLRAYWLPVALLVFMVPLPEVAISDLNFRLKGIASDAAMGIIDLLQIPALREGSFVYLPGVEITADGDEVRKSLEIENVCSGLRSLISLTFFGAMFAMVCRVKGWWRVVLLLAAMPVAVGCNVVRITGLIIVAHYDSIDAATAGGWFHDLSGLAVFGIALGAMFGLELIILLLSRKLGRDWVDTRLMGYIDRIKAPPGGRLRIARPVVLVVLLLATGWGAWLAWAGYRTHTGKLAAHCAPAQVVVDGHTYAGEDYSISEQSQDILFTEDFLSRVYYPESGRYGDPDTPFSLLVIYSANNRKGTHPPDVCLEGGGESIISRRNVSVDIDGLGEVRMRELVTQRMFEGRMRWNHYLFVYKMGGSYTPSFFSQQFWIFVNGFIQRDTSGALVRFSAASGETGRDASRELVYSAAQTLMPHIHRGLQRPPEQASNENDGEPTER